MTAESKRLACFCSQGSAWQGCLLIALSLTFVLSCPGAQNTSRPPNFIVILADDLGAGELGCYANAEFKTPNLDRLASEGMRFETAYATPLCSPTRVALMTGQYAFRTGWFNLIGRPLSPDPASPEYDIGAKTTFADVLKKRGYATALAGKWQLSGKIPSLVHDCGFDEYRMWAYTHNLPEGVTHVGGYENKARTTPSRYWHPSIVQNGKYLPTAPDDYGPDLFNAFIVDFIRRNRARPFCVYYTSPLTHAPHVETPDPTSPGKRWPEGFKSNLEYLDHLVGKLVSAVDELGLREQTVIVFVGDNGTAGRGKGQVSELGARVPFIVRCPGTVKAGVVSRALTDITDIFPTLAQFAGAELPANQTMDGKSLVPVLRGTTTRHRDWIFSFLRDGRVLRDARWLLEVNGANERLFDCGDSRDGTGYQNVTDSTSAEVTAARVRMRRILESLPGPQNHPGLIPQGPDNTKGAKAGKKGAGKRNKA